MQNRFDEYGHIVEDQISKNTEIINNADVMQCTLDQGINGQHLLFPSRFRLIACLFDIHVVSVYFLGALHPALDREELKFFKNILQQDCALSHFCFPLASTAKKTSRGNNS